MLRPAYSMPAVLDDDDGWDFDTFPRARKAAAKVVHAADVAAPASASFNGVAPPRPSDPTV